MRISFKIISRDFRKLKKMREKYWCYHNETKMKVLHGWRSSLVTLRSPLNCLKVIFYWSSVYDNASLKMGMDFGFWHFPPNFELVRHTMPYLMTTTTHRSLSTKGELVYNYSRHGPAFYCQKDSGRRHISNIDQRVWCFQEVVIHIFGIVFATPRLTQTWKFPSIFVDTEPRTDWMANNELLLKPWYHIML